MRKIFYCFVVSLLCGCTGLSKDKRQTSNQIPFKYFNGTFIVVPVTINGTITKDFIFDTGAGTNLISKSLSAELGLVADSKFKGKRMSGQEIEVPMSSVSSLTLGSVTQQNVPVAIFDLEGFVPGAEIGGMLSLSFFRNVVFTIDYTKNVISIENPESLKSVKAGGTAVPVKFDIQGPSLGILMPLVLPNGKQVSVEVDTGSQALILDEKFMKPLGYAPTDKRLKSRDGKDETGHIYKRYFTKLNGKVHLPAAPEMSVDSPAVMFQKIIYDGLVGHYFLEQFLVTYNIPRSEMIFRKR